VVTMGQYAVPRREFVVCSPPITSGQYSFQVSVTDGLQETASANYNLVVGPPGEFYTSTATLNFTALPGGAMQVQPLGVDSNDQGAVKFQVASDTPWLTTSPSSGTVPANVSVQVDPSKLTATPSIGHLTLTPDGGKQPVTVTVNATLWTPTPHIGAAPESVEVDISPDPNAAKSYQLGFQVWNDGAGTLSAQISASASMQNWLTVQPGSASLAPGQNQALTVNVSAAGLPVGTYRAAVTIQSATQLKTIPVILVVPETQYTPLLRLTEGSGFNGYYCDWMFGSSLPDCYNVLVFNDVTHVPMDFTATLSGFGSNANLKPTQGHIDAQPPGAADEIGFPLGIQFSDSGLGVGKHEGLLEVTAPGALGSPAHVKITINVASRTDDQGKVTWQSEFRDTSLDVQLDPPVLVAGPGAPRVKGQLTIVNPTGMPVSFTVSSPSGAFTFDQSQTTVPAGGSSTLKVAVDPTKLDPQKAWDSLIARAESWLGASALWAIPAATVTPASGGGSDSRARLEPLVTSCAPSKLVMAPSGPPIHFRRLADWPQSIGAAVYDDCGNPVKDALVTASFSNGDAGLSLPLANAAKGLYAGAWIPGGLGGLSVTLRAMKGTLTPATTQIFGTILEDQGAPVIFNSGMIHNLNPVSGAPASPGLVLAIYGKNMASAPAVPDAVPLPRQLAGTSVLIGGIQAPLYYVSPGQITLQVPAELAANAPYDVVVQSGERFSTPKRLVLAKLSPGVAALADGHVIAQHSDYSLVTAASPAKAGEYLILYLAGLGPTDPAVASGAASPVNPLAHVIAKPSVSAGGIDAEVSFAGLTPGSVGLYQINFKVPGGIAVGDQPLVITQEGLFANAVTLPVGK